MSDLSLVRLGDICLLKAGNAFPKEQQGVTFGDVPFIKVSDFELPGNERRITRANNFLSEATARDLKVKRHRKGGVAFAKIGIALTYNRRRLLTRDTAVDNNLMVAEAIPELCDHIYFYYLLRTVDFNLIANGSALPYLNASDIRNIEVAIHTKSEQKTIAHILGTLDDKIELNRKTNETLEAMANALFKSWFVDFDPVKAKAEGHPTGLPAEISDLFPDSFEDSELGEIPSGWRVTELGDISTISGGKQLESVELKDKGRFPVYGANGTMGFHNLATHNSFVIVFGRVGAYCGSINWEYGGAWVNNNASSLIPLRYNEFVLQWMLEADYSNYRTGSAQPFIPNSALACSPVLMPTDALASVFCDLLLPFRLKQKKNQSAALSLVEIRDALLPKLISGEIRIPDTERMLEEVGI